MRDEPAWWAQARRLRADGLTLKAIGTHVGKTEAAVSVAVSDRLRKLQTHAQPVLRGNSSGEAAFVAAHTPHIARKTARRSRNSRRCTRFRQRPN
jgi:DNA-binding NarL/FixJ family response regulator